MKLDDRFPILACGHQANEVNFQPNSYTKAILKLCARRSYAHSYLPAIAA
jgi:hypothetical protein